MSTDDTILQTPTSLSVTRRNTQKSSTLALAFRWLTRVEHDDPAQRVFGSVFAAVVTMMGIGGGTLALINTLAGTPLSAILATGGVVPCMALAWWLNRRGHWIAPLLTTLVVLVAIPIGFAPQMYVDVNNRMIIHAAFVVPALLAAIFFRPAAGLPVALLTALLLGIRAYLAGFSASQSTEFVVYAIVHLGGVTSIVALTAAMVARAIRQATDLQQNLDRRVAERTEELQRLHQSWQEQTAESTHDLRSLMMAVNAELEALSFQLDYDTVDEATLREAFSRIRATCEMEAGLVSDLHTLSVLKANAKALILRVERYDLAARIRTMASSLVIYAQTKNLTLTVDAPTEVIVEADPVRMDRVLLNLVTNAIKFTRNLRVQGDGLITVSLQCADAWAILRVADNGIGVSAAGLTQIGQRWVREHRDGMPEGTGLGLNFSATITALMGGELIVDSPGEGQGTIVEVRLPLASLVSEAANAI